MTLKINDATMDLCDIMASMDRDRALEVLTQCAGSQRRLGVIVGVSEEHISRWRSGKYPVPAWVVVMAEAMEMIAPKDWPSRWSEK